MVRSGLRRGLTAAGLVLLMMASPKLSAQDVTVRAYLDRTRVGLNQQFVLSVEIAGANRIASDPRLPDMSAFSQSLGTSSSQQIQIVNGRTSVSTTLQYRFLATREGAFQIEAVELELGGRQYTTEPLQIEVVPAGAGQPPPPAAQGRAPAARAGDAIAEEDLFLRVTASKRSVYQNEPVILEYEIYTRVPVTSYSLARQPGTTGFWVEDFDLPAQPETRAEIVNGMRYTVATLKKVALFPTSPGSRTIEPMAIETELRVRDRAIDPFDDFFRGGSLFGRTVTKVVASEAVAIDVLPLPAEDQPPDFTGLVGRLTLSATADKTEAGTNEAVTLSVRIAGEGNLRLVPEPVIEFPADFEIYPPEVTEAIDRDGNRIAGRKTYDYVLIPRAPGRKTIPPIRMSYFAPSANGYRTVETEPIEIEVTGDAATAPVTMARGRGAIRTLREDIRFIQTEPPRFRPVGRSLLQHAGFWVVLLAPLTLLGGALGYRRHADRLAGDVAYARHRRASRIARKRMATARSRAHPETAGAFYAEAATALTGFLADRLNVAEAGLIREDARNRLLERGVSPEVVASYLDCLAVCDRMRFAPSAAESQEMRALLTRAEQEITSLDRALSQSR